jgi:hypothetical protein
MQQLPKISTSFYVLVLVRGQGKTNGFFNMYSFYSVLYLGQTDFFNMEIVVIYYIYCNEYVSFPLDRGTYV